MRPDVFKFYKYDAHLTQQIWPRRGRRSLCLTALCSYLSLAKRTRHGDGQDTPIFQFISLFCETVALYLASTSFNTDLLFGGRCAVFRVGRTTFRSSLLLTIVIHLARLPSRTCVISLHSTCVSSHINILNSYDDHSSPG